MAGDQYDFEEAAGPGGAEELARLPGWTWAAWTPPQFAAFVAQLTPRHA